MNNLRTISTSFNHTFRRKFFSVQSRQRSLMRRAKPPTAVPEKLEIRLTDVESRICQLLHDCSQTLLQEKGISVTCRVAGGWVRDKLLGSQSNDMDVALSDIMGLAFAEYLADFARSKGVETGTIAKIETNPDQSKHLETATFKIFGLDLDLVNLRSEEYATGSRIPTGVTFGTPLQDALRRDITINALFYNVHSREVEDHTEKGLDDLRHGIVRTPMPPRETFHDDPLRILRCVRFASRFGFAVVEEVKEAVKDPAIQEALVAKVARERVGDEVGKMIKGPDPLRAAQLIYELNLYHPIFSVIPPEAKTAMPPSFFADTPTSSICAPSILDVLISKDVPDFLQPHPLLLSPTVDDSSTKSRLFLAALLLPYVGVTYQDSKKKCQQVITAAIRDSLKLGVQNHYLDGIPTLFSALPLVESFIREHQHTDPSRAKLGLFLRNKLVHNPSTGSHWSSTLLFSMVTELVHTYSVESDSFDTKEASKIVTKYNDFIGKVTAFSLQDEVDRKPLLNGNEIGQALQVGKPGPWVGKVLEDVVEWQLAHPGASKDECISWLATQDSSKYLSEDNAHSKPAKRIRTK